MNSNSSRSPSWLMADGAASISASMLVAVLINAISPLAGLWGLGFLHTLTLKNDGMIVVASLLLLPTSFTVYGVSQMIFAAKEAVERRVERRVAERTRKAERERVRKAFAEFEKIGVQIPPEVAQFIARDPEGDS